MLVGDGRFLCSSLSGMSSGLHSSITWPVEMLLVVLQATFGISGHPRLVVTNLDALMKVQAQVPFPMYVHSFSPWGTSSSGVF